MKSFEEWNGAGCPACGEDTDLYYGSMNVDSSMVDQEASCYNCGLKWYDLYRLVGYEFVTYQGEPVFVGKEGEQL